jgi:hypothetical protein
VQCAPVGDGTFAEGRAARDHTEQEDGAADARRPVRGTLPGSLLLGVAGEERRGDQRGHGEPDDRHAEEVHGRRHRCGDQPADGGAGESAEAEAGMQRRQHRLAGCALDLHAHGVGRDVGGARGRPEQQERDPQLYRGRGQTGQRERGAGERGGGGADQSGAEPGAERAGQLHARERTE